MEPEIAGAANHGSGASSEPAPSNRRWTVRRKAAIVEAVRSGRVSLDAICQAYKLSIEEFLAWERDMDRYGVPGLRATRYQSIVRPRRERPAKDGPSRQTDGPACLIDVGARWHRGDLATAPVRR
jgi:hypothetical protein